MGRQTDIKPTLEKILSYNTLEIKNFDEDDLIVGAQNTARYHIDLNDSVNLAIMLKNGIIEAYTNDRKHLGKIDFLNILFE